MSKRQNLFKLSITLIMIMALVVGIVLATGIDTGAKGGLPIEGETVDSSTPAPFADMPDSSNYVHVTTAAFEEASNVTLDGMTKLGNVPDDTGSGTHTEHKVTTAAEFVFAFTNSHPGVQFRLENNFILKSPGFFNEIISSNDSNVDHRLKFDGSGAVMNGNGKNVVVDYVTSAAAIDTKATAFGGFLSGITGGATVKNLNYYLSPQSLLILANNEFGHDSFNQWTTVHINVGGFAGVVNDSTVKNCSINIYGTVYSLRMQDRGENYPYVGGAIGSTSKATLTNNVFNVIGATVSASSHGTHDTTSGAKYIGGVCAKIDHSTNTGNVLNVSPSTIVGADLLGYNSARVNTTSSKEEITSNKSYHYVGTYLGRMEGTKTEMFVKNTYVNYNDLLTLNSHDSGTNSWMLPPGVGGNSDAGNLNTSDARLFKTYGASFYGDDFKFIPESNGNMTLHVNSRSWTNDTGANAFKPTDNGYTANSSQFTNGYSKDYAAAESLYFYDGINTTDKTAETFLIDDTYSWNRLVSISGTAYYTDNIYHNKRAAVVDPFANMPKEQKEAATQFKKYRQDVKIDTKGNNGRFVFSSQAAPAFALDAHITGNNATYVSGTSGPTEILPENNIVVFDDMTRNTGVIRRFNANNRGNNGASNAGFYNLQIENRASISDGAAVVRYVGGLVDIMSANVTIDSCVINNDFQYIKTGIDKENMVTIANTAGSLYYGGMFGFNNGSIKNSVINATTGIDIKLLRYGGDTTTAGGKEGERIYNNEVAVAGFAAETNDFVVENSIINVVAGALQEKHTYQVFSAGLVAKASGTFTATNSQLSSKVGAFIGGEKKWAGSAVSGKSSVAGLIARMSQNVSITNSRIDLDISADHKQSLDTNKAYMIETCDSSGSVILNNVAINTHNNLKAFGDREMLGATIPANFTNAWFYNVNNEVTMASIKGDNGNVINASGNTLSDGKADINLKGAHNMFQDEHNKPFPQKVVMANLNNYWSGFSAQSSPKQFEFFVKPATSFYDMRRQDKVKRTALVGDELKNRPNMISPTAVNDGVQSYTGAYIGVDTTPSQPKVETISPITSLKHHGGLGWFAGSTKTTIGEGNFLTSDKYTANVYPVKALDSEGNYVIGYENDVEMHVVDHYDYSLVVPRDVVGDSITALLSTYDIKNSGEWNQVAQNYNDGLLTTTVDLRVSDNINATTLTPMGTHDEKAFIGKISGQMLYAVDKDGKITTKELGYPTITTKNIQGVKNPVTDTTAHIQGKEGTVGLFGYVGQYAEVANLNVVGANLLIEPTEAKAGKILNYGTVVGINNGTIKNVHLTIDGTSSITLYTSQDVRYGLFAGYSNGKIIGCSVDTKKDARPNVKLTNNKPSGKPIFYLGGLVGINNGSIKDTAVNLGLFSFATAGSMSAINAGAIGWQQSAITNIDGLYVAVLQDNFDTSLGSKSALVANINSTNSEPAQNYKGIVVGYANGIVDNIKVAAEQQKPIPELNSYDGSAADFGSALTKKTGVNLRRIRPDDDDAASKLESIAEIVFTPGIDAENNSNVTIALRNVEDFALAGFKYDTPGATMFERNSTYTALLSEIAANNNIVITIKKNTISNEADWNDVADDVNSGATFNGYIFKITQNITFTSAPHILGDGAVIGEKKNAFEGIISGGSPSGNMTITLPVINSVNARTHHGLIGILGVNGEINNLNVKVNASYNVAKAKNAAVLVAENKGIIDNVSVIVNSNAPFSIVAKNAKGDNAGLTGNAGILTGRNIGTIKNSVLEFKGSNSNKSVVKGTYSAGAIAGISTSEEIDNITYDGLIQGVTVTMGYLQVGAAGNGEDAYKNAYAGLLVGSNDGNARMVGVVNNMITNYNSASKDYYVENTDYFVKNIAHKEVDQQYIKNVWGYVKLAVPNKVNDVPRYNTDIFNVMYSKTFATDSGTVEARASGEGVAFTATADTGHFYGFVTNFENSKLATSNKTYTVYDSVGVDCAAVFANKQIRNMDDMNNLAAYSEQSGVVVKGLEFELDFENPENDPTLVQNKTLKFSEFTTVTAADGTTSRKRVKWNTIEQFDHKINGSAGYVIEIDSTVFKATSIFDGLFNTIGESGGLNNITFKFVGNVGRGSANGVNTWPKSTKEYDGFIAKYNHGTIENINIELKGMITAFEGAGVVAGYNDGTIDTVNVSMIYSEADEMEVNEKAIENSATPTSILAKNAGIITGVNAGIVSNSHVNLKPNTLLRGMYTGGLVGYNKSNGVIFGASNSESVTINGKLEGQYQGGAAGLNDGVISGINVAFNNFETPDAATSAKTRMFGGIASVNNGYIEDVVVNVNADTTAAEWQAAAGIAYASSGYIGGIGDEIGADGVVKEGRSSIVNINKPFVAKNIIAGVVVNNNDVETGDVNTGVINNVTIPCVITNIVVNINNKMSALNVAGLAFENGAKNYDILINIPDNGSLVGVKPQDDKSETRAAMLGIRAMSNSATPVSTIKYELGDNGVFMEIKEHPEAKLDNANIVIDASKAPVADTVTASYLEKIGKVEYKNSWLLRRNNYAIDKGNVGLNEYKIVSTGQYAKNVAYKNNVKTVEFKTYVSDVNATVLLREAFAETDSFANSILSPNGETEFTMSGSAYTFTPNPDSVNRVMILSQYKMDIASVADYVEVNKNLDNNDLFYDVPIYLTNDLTLNAETIGVGNKISPLGYPTTGFNSKFIGNKCTINLDYNLVNTKSGLFGEIGAVGLVKDLILNVGEGVTIGSDNMDEAGGLAGVINGKVENVAVKIYNNGDETLLPNIVASQYTGAFAGFISPKAQLNNAWVFMQNGKYPAANGNNSNSGNNNGFNLVNLGGVDDVTVRFMNDSLDFNIAILTNRLDNVGMDSQDKSGDWSASGNGDRPIINNDMAYALDGKTIFNMPTYKESVVYNVSLIPNTIKNVNDLMFLADNQRGFNISKDEVFELVPENGHDITIDTATLKAYYEGPEFQQKSNKQLTEADKKVFYSIGTSVFGREFKSKFHGNGHTIVIDSDVIVRETEGELAGLFGRIGRDAEINGLKVVVNTNVTNLDARLYAGGLAGDNKSSNIHGVVVEVNGSTELPAKSTMQFGGIYGSNTAVEPIKDVYLVKDYNVDIPSVAEGVLGNINTINRFRLNNEELDLDLTYNNVDSSYSITPNVITLDADYYGMIDTTVVQNKLESIDDAKKRATIQAISGVTDNVNREYAVVFANTTIKNIADFNRIIELIESGFNVRWLEYKFADVMDEDIVFKGVDTKDNIKVLNGICDGKDSAFKAIFNGNGKTIAFENARIKGVNAGLFGTIAKGGIVQNLVVSIKNIELGYQDTKETKNSTVDAGAIAAHNNGIIENVILYNNGGYVSKANGTSNIMIATNTGTLNNVWFIENNPETETKLNVDKINVLNLVGNEIKLTNFAFTKGDITFDSSSKSGFDRHIYNESSMTNALVATKLPAENPSFRRYVMTDFDLVIDSSDDYVNFTESFNNGNTSFRGVTVTLKGDANGELVLEKKMVSDDLGKKVEQKYHAIGTGANPFDGTFNGNGVKLILAEDATIENEIFAGVFGNIGSLGQVTNLYINVKGHINGKAAIFYDKKTDIYSASEIYVAAIAYSNGIIRNTIIEVDDQAKITYSKIDNTNISGYNYNKNVHTAGGIVITNTELENVWYMRDTAAVGTLAVATTTTQSNAKINRFTKVGKQTEMVNEGKGLVEKPIAFSASILPSGEIKFEAGSGSFINNFVLSDAEMPNVQHTENGIAVTVKVSGGTYEWVNYDYKIEDASDWAQLAIDTKGGYNFNNKTPFVVSSLEIPATSDYSLGHFAGTMNSAVLAKDAVNITVKNDAVANSKDFSLIDTIDPTGVLNNITIKLGTNEPLKVAFSANKVGGIVTNVNNGQIIGGSVDANIVTSDIVNAFAIVVGENNNKLTGIPAVTTGQIAPAKPYKVNVVATVATPANPEDPTSKPIYAPNTIEVAKAYGHVAVNNNANISNIDVTVIATKVKGNVGNYSYFVADNKESGVITDAHITIGEKSSVAADHIKPNVYVGTLAGHNIGSIKDSTVLFNGDPDYGEYFLAGHWASLIVGDNDNAIDNILVDASHDISAVAHYDKDAAKFDNVQHAGHVLASKNSANKIDVNGASGDYGNGNIWIIVSDSDKAMTKDVATTAAYKIIVSGKGDIEAKLVGDMYQFTAKENLEKYPDSQFNGWYKQGSNVKLETTSPDIDNSNDHILAVAQGKGEPAYEVVFLATSIKDEADWNHLAHLVNTGKNVASVTYKIADDVKDGQLVLKAPIAIGNAEYPFRGTFDGNGKTIVIAGNMITDENNIRYDYAALFAYIDAATIKDTNVIVNKGVTIEANIGAAALVGQSVGASNITNLAKSKPMNIINNGNIVSHASDKAFAAGAVADINAGTVEFIHIVNNGFIRSTSNVDAYAGGAIGYDMNAVIKSVSVKNVGQIRGNVAGGLVGMHNSGEAIDGFSVDSVGDAIIFGNTHAGALAGSNNGKILHGGITYSSNSPETTQTKALVSDMTIDKDKPISNVWVITTPDVDVLTKSVDALNKVVDGGGDPVNSLRIVRSNDIANITRAVQAVVPENDYTTPVYKSNITNDGTFDYWTETATGRALKVGTDSFFTANGLAKTGDGANATTATSIDVTLEKIGTIDKPIMTIDHIEALAMFASNKDAQTRAANAAPAEGPAPLLKNTFYLGQSIDLTGKNIDVDLLKFIINGQGNTITIDKTTDIQNGQLNNIVIALDTTKDVDGVTLSSNALTLGTGTILVDGLVYDVIPERTGEYNQFLVNGIFDLTHVAPLEGAEVQLVTRDKDLIVDKFQMKYIIGNVPLYNNNGDITGYNDIDSEYANYEVGYQVKDTENVTYYFYKSIVGDTKLEAGGFDETTNNFESVLHEINYLLNMGYTFEGKEIMVTKADRPLVLPDELVENNNPNALLGDESSIFEGTLNGGGCEIKYRDTYKPFFYKVGPNGLIKNFVISANIKDGVSVFHGYKKPETDPTQYGNLANMIIINNNTATKYPQADVDYNKVLVIQGSAISDNNYSGVIAATKDLYTKIFALNVNTNMGSVRDSVIIDSKLDENGDSSFTVKSNGISNKAHNVMFGGFYGYTADTTDNNSALVEGFEAGITVDSLTDQYTTHGFNLHLVSNQITSAESWNAIADNTRNVASANTNEVISMTADIDLTSTGTLKTLGTAGNMLGKPSADIDGGGHKIILNANHKKGDYVINGYNGKISNLVIDASNTVAHLTLEDVINTSAGIGTYDKVIVITRRPAPEAAGVALAGNVSDIPGLANIVLDDDIVFNYGADAKELNFTVDNTHMIHIMDNYNRVVKTAKYGTLNLNNKMKSYTYNVHKVDAIYDQFMLETLTYVDSAMNIELANDITMEIPVVTVAGDKELKLDLKKSVAGEYVVTLDGNGHTISLVDGFELTITDINVKNAIFNGAGKVILAGDVLTKSVIANKNIEVTAPTIGVKTGNEIWAGVKKDNITYLNFADSTSRLGNVLYAIEGNKNGAFDGNFVVKIMSDDERYFIGLFNGESNIPSDNEGIATTGIVDETSFTLSADTTGDFRYLSSYISGANDDEVLAAYNNVIAEVNKSTKLNNKKFYLGSDLVIDDSNKLTHLNSDKTIILSGRVEDASHVVNRQEIDIATISDKAFENVTIESAVINFKHYSKVDPNVALAAILGNEALVITYENYVPTDEQIAPGNSNYLIIRVRNYHKTANNYYGYNKADKVVKINLDTTTDFYTRQLNTTISPDGQKTAKLSDRMNETIDIVKTLEAGIREIDVKFYLPLNISFTKGGTDADVAQVVGNIPREIEYTSEMAAGSNTMDIPLNIDNIILRGYKINGVNVPNYGTTIKLTDIDMHKFVIKLDVDRFNVTGGYKVINPNTEYIARPVVGTKPYAVTYINEILKNYPLSVDYGFKVSDDDALINKTQVAVGTYDRVLEIYIDSSKMVIGRIKFVHTVRPYALTDNDLKFVSREYIASDYSAMIDTTNPAYMDLEESVRTELEAAKFTYNQFDTGNNIRVNLPSGGVQLTNKNYVLNAIYLYANIVPRQVTVTMPQSAFASREFRHDTSGYNVYKDIDVMDILANATVNVDGVVKSLGKIKVSTDAQNNEVREFVANDGMTAYIPTSINKFDNDGVKGYFYINNNGAMLDVADNMKIINNIANTKNFKYVVNGVEYLDTENSLADVKDITTKALNNVSQTITKTTYKFDMVDNPNSASKNFLRDVVVADSFVNKVMDTSGNLISPKINASVEYAMWNDVSMVIGDKRIYTMKPGEENAHSITAKLSTLKLVYGQVINPNNYILEANITGDIITGQTFTTKRINIGDDLTLQSKTATFNGSVPKLGVKFMFANNMNYRTAGLTAEAAFVNPDTRFVNPNGDHKYDVAIRVYSNVLTGEDRDITKYIDCTNADLAFVNEGGYFLDKFEIEKAKTEMNYTGDRTYTYYDSAMNNIPNSELIYIKTTDYRRMFLKGGIFDDFVMTYKNALGEEITFSEAVDAGNYTVVFDPAKNTKIAENIDLVNKTNRNELKIKVNPKLVDITLSLADKNIVYGDKFGGHTIKATVDGKVWDKVSNVSFTYTDENIVPGETIYNAGTTSFAVDKFDIKLDANHYFDTKKVQIDSLSVAKKPVHVEIGSVKVNKYYKQSADIASQINRALVITNPDGTPGLVYPKDKSSFKGQYTYKDIVGKQDVVLTSVSSPNYVMVNVPKVAKGVLEVKKVDCAVTIQEITKDDTLLTTTIKFQAKVKGGKTMKNLEFTVQGLLETDEEYNTAITDYLTLNKDIGVDSYNMKFTNEAEPVLENEYKEIIPTIALGIMGLLALIALAILISSIVVVHNMPSGFNKDFNFSRDPNKNDVENLMKAGNKRRNTEYKKVSAELKKAAKKGKYYNIEDSLYPPVEGENLTADEENDEPSDETK